MTDKTKEAPARSALKMALAVLQEWHKGFPDDWTDFDTEAITAIREALAKQPAIKQDLTPEQPAQPQQEPDNWKDRLIAQHEETILWQAKRIGELMDQTAQPQQEPVAIGWYIEGFSCVLGLIRPEVRYEDWRPFYALRKPPAQRTWVGLMDEEISKMPAWIYSPDQDGMTAEEGLEVFARAIEAKLKEKNR